MLQQATKFEFVINRKAAKQIGLTIPVNVIERARERSKPFGTRIEIRDGMGVARPG